MARFSQHRSELLMLKKIGKTIFVLFLFSAGMAVGVIAIAQTKWFKKQLEAGLQDIAKKNGLSLTLVSIEGSLPLQWKLTQVSLQKKDEFALSIQEVKVRLSFLPLLQRKLVISYLKTAGAELVIEQQKEWRPNIDLFFTLASPPLDLSLRSFRIDRFSIKGAATAEFAAKGTFLVKKRAKKIEIKISVQDLLNGNQLEFTATGGRNKRYLAIQASSRIGNLSSLVPKDKLFFFEDSSAALFCTLAGPWSTWEKLFGKPSSVAEAPLKGALRSSLAPWKFDADFLVSGDRSFEIAQGALHSSLGQLQVKGKFKPGGEPWEGSLFLEIPALAALHPQAKGEIKARASLSNGSLQADVAAKNILAGYLHLPSCHGALYAENHEGVWQGLWEGTTESGHVSASTHANFAFDPKTSSFTLQEIDLQAPSISLAGQMAFHYAPFSVSGDLRLQAQDLQTLHPFLPAWQLAGQCGGSLHFSGNDELVAKLHAVDMQWRGVHIGCGDLYAELTGPLHQPRGKIDIDAERVYFTHAYFSSLHLKSTSDYQGWPVAVEAEGTWKYPFKFSLDARYRHSDGENTIAFNKLDALFLEQPLHLERPALLAWQPGQFRIDELAFKIGGGQLFGSLNKTAEQFLLSLNGDKLPVSWLTTFTPYLALEGESSLACNIAATKDTIQGSCRLDLSSLHAIKRGDTTQIYAKGTVEARLSPETLQVHSYLHASEEQVMLLHLTLPLSYNMSPFAMRVVHDRPISGSFEVEGKLEEIFNFANTGSQSISGWAAGKMHLFGTLNKPQLLGNLSLEQASYANHFIGLGFNGVEASLRAEKDKLYIDRLTASDAKQGSLVMQGEMQLDAESHFPYRFTGNFERFDAIDLDLVQAKLTGTAVLEGDFAQALLQGSFNVDSAEATIPKSLPADLPDLPFTFSDPSIQEMLAPATRAFPMAIDITFDSNDTVTFQGNGLTSTWGGRLHLHGVNLNLLASGTLRLAKGQFQILGKTFLLQQGELTFSDKPGQEGFLNLTGTLNLHDATITAQLRGPLSSPQLSFHANPALTTNEIFSLLLFNKRVSEIKPVQAVQLAHTILTFYGHTGWNPVSQIGTGLNALGIDTFDIVPSEEGLKQSSITIGKHFYLVRDMLVTLTQSRDSRRFQVEVDIGKGFLLQAENLSGPEQSQQEGKFSLKWNKNY